MAGRTGRRDRGREFLLAPISARTWRELGYLLLGAPLIGIIFALMVTGLFGGAFLLITLVGLPLLAGLVAAARRVGGLWRWLSRVCLRSAVAAPAPRQRRAGLVGFTRSGLRDGAGWRSIAFIAVKFPLGLLGAFAAGLLWCLAIGAVVSPVIWSTVHTTTIDSHGRSHHYSLVQFGNLYIDTWPKVIVVSALGVVLCFLAPWPVRALAELDRRLIRRLLGPNARDLRVAELERTRSRAVEDSVATLRRVERDLHDGTQARLVAVAMNLSRARTKLGPDQDGVRDLIDSAHSTAKDALVELRDVVRSIRPPALDHGLEAALATLTARSAVPVTLTTRVESRASVAVETIAYFCVAELLTNVARHSGATRAHVEAWTDRDILHLRVSDDGHGGAHPVAPPDRGAGGQSGLRGLHDRVSTVDGAIDLDSPAGGPTVATVVLPLTTSPDERGQR